MRWFRYHADALDDPKVQKLDGETFKVWVNLLSLACRNNGKLPCEADIAFALRMDLNAIVTVLERLLNATLIDRQSGGPNGFHYAPHGWHERQYKSDTSTGRVKRFRKRSETVAETPSDTDTDTDITLAKASGENAPSDKVFWDNAKAYIGGKNPGALIGKWVRDHGKDATASAITASQLERAVEPISFITRTIGGGKQAGIRVGI